MTEEIEDPLSELAEETNAEVIPDAAKEVETQDILVCGKCHEVFHFVEGFQEHKTKDDCKGNGELKETLIDEKKPQIWAFTLWKNTKFKDTKEEDKPPTSWSLYQLWRSLEDTKKDAWIKAGENLQALIEISAEFEKIQNSKMESKTEEMIENEEDSCTDSGNPSKEKDPLAEDDDDKSTGNKKVLKPVQINNKKKLMPIRQVKDSKTNKVNEILSKRYNPRKRTFEYLIKWENVDPNEPCTWEPVASLTCKAMLEEFDKKLQIQKEQQKVQKLLAKKKAKKTEVIFPEGRPQRTSKQKALNQVKVWCGNMEADENSGKRVFSDDSEDDDAFEKRLKFEEYSSDSENDTPVVTIKRIQKSQNGVEKKLTKVEPQILPENILIPDAKGIVRINQKQIPSLSSGVYVMSKTAGIIKLDTKASKLATSGGQTVLKVAPKIGQTSIKVIKKDMSNGTIQQTKQTANILRAKPVIRNYSSKVYMAKKTNAQNAAKKAAAAAAAAAAASTTESPRDEEKDDDESDGVEELEFPTDIPIPAPDSPPPDFTLCPLTGKVLGKDGMPLETEVKEEALDNTATLDNLVNMAAADILEDLKEESDKTKDNLELEKSDKDMEVDEPKEDAAESSISETPPEDPIAVVTTTKPASTTEVKITDSILSTALTNANIPIRRPSATTTITPQRIIQQKTILNRTIGQTRSTPQAIITRITPGNSVVQRSRVTAPKPREATIIRKRTSMANTLQNRSLVRRVGDTKVYTPSSSGQGHQVVSTYVATPTSGTVISMPSLIDSEAMILQENAGLKEAKSEAAQQKPEVQNDETPTTSAQNAVSLNSLSLGDPETPLLITGEDGTIYQVAGQNEDGQTILITRGENGEQQCLLVAPENAGVINQVLMKPEAEESEPEPENEPATEPAVDEPLSVTTESEEAADDSQVVAQIVSANPPSPGGTRKVVLMLPDGNFMMTEVTAEQYAALELDK